MVSAVVSAQGQTNLVVVSKKMTKTVIPAFKKFKFSKIGILRVKKFIFIKIMYRVIPQKLQKSA